MASAKKVRRQKNLKIFLPECSCRTERAAVRSPVRVSGLSTEMLFDYREIVYGELSAPMRYNLLIPEYLSRVYNKRLKNMGDLMVP